MRIMLFENSPPQHRQEIWNKKPPNQIEINHPSYHPFFHDIPSDIFF